MPKDEKAEKAPYENPRCEKCAHVRSFHGGGTTRCRALGCKCVGFNGAVPASK